MSFTHSAIKIFLLGFEVRPAMDVVPDEDIVAEKSQK